MRTTRARPKPRRRTPRRNPPSVPEVLRRARAVASLAERLNELGREERVAMEYDSHARVQAIQAETDQILTAAERVVREITELLGDGMMARARRNPPSRDALVAALRRARAVLVLTERNYDLGHSVAELRREGYRAMAQEHAEESYAITKAAQRSVREIGDLLGEE